MQSVKWLLLTIPVLLAVTLSGCGGEDSEEEITDTSGGEDNDAATPTLRIGGQLQDSYVDAFQLWANSSNDNFAIQTSFASYNSGTLAADVAAMTSAGNSAYVDVLVCPYTSGATTNCVNAVNSSYQGAVLSWGGAADSIFSGACATLNCFGFFTVASSYMTTGLEKLANMSGNMSVGIIVNNNAFSSSVATGAEAAINATGFTLAGKVQLSVAKQAITDADKSNIADLMSSAPDVVLIAGHNGDVEPVIIEIGNGSHMPQAILATNALNNLDNYGGDVKFANCVMMPTQWEESDTAVADAVPWTSTAFKTAMAAAVDGMDASDVTYHYAAAAASMVAVAQAMKDSSYDPSLIAAKMKEMDMDSFYGTLKWSQNGAIEKPMFTQQKKGDALEIVAPRGTVAFPLSDSSCWGQ